VSENGVKVNSGRKNYSRWCDIKGGTTRIAYINIVVAAMSVFAPPQSSVDVAISDEAGVMASCYRALFLFDEGLPPDARKASRSSTLKLSL